MNSPAIPRLPELEGEVFDDEYRRAEIDLPHELESILPAFEISLESLPFPCRFFSGEKMQVIDIGCGIGTLAHLLAQKNPQATVTGIDINAASIEYGRQHYAPGVENLHYQVGSVDQLGEQCSDIDLITCVGAMHHFPDLQVAVGQIMQALGKRGVFLLSDMNRENLLSFFSAKELKYLDSIRKLPKQVGLKKLRRQGYLKGEKLRRFLTLMSFQAAYTPTEVAAALGSAYAFKGRISGFNYILAIYRL